MGTFSNDNDDSWKKLASEGDEQAFKLLFDRYHSRLFRYIVSLVKSKQIAEELVMDVFLKLWLAREMIIEIENMDGFLFKVARNKALDFFQSAARDRKFIELLGNQISSHTSTSADASLLTKEFEDKLRKAIDLLPPKRKEIFNLSREGNLTHAEIAKTLGISKNTVANTIVEAKQFIQRYLTRDLHVIAILIAVLSVLEKK